MRTLFLAAALLAMAGCSPTTDITRTSTEMIAGRTPYQVVRTESSGDLLRVQMKVYSTAAARTVAEDVVVRKRGGYNRAQVELYGWSDRMPGSSPFAVLRWSTKNGFSYAATR